MDLLENPFHVLGASPRDGRQRLLELATERGALGDPDACDRARAILTHPRKRLSAEMAWLPDVAPQRAVEAIATLQSDPRRAAAMDGLPPLARANLMAAAVTRFGDTVEDAGLTDTMCELGRVFDMIDVDQLRTLLSEERAVAGLPDVKETAVVTEVLAERRRHFREAMKTALDQLPSRRLVQVVTEVVDRATRNGTVHAPILIDDLVDGYEVEAHRFLEAEAVSVEALVGAVRRAVKAKLPRDQLERLYERLEMVVRNWDAVAQPIQLSYRSRGRSHDLSNRVGVTVRELGVRLCNDHGLLEDAKRLTALLQDAFAEVPELVDRTDEDAKAIKGIYADRQRNEQEQKEWEEAVRYRTERGIDSKQPFSISVEGIESDGRLLPLEAITRVRWGGIAHYDEKRVYQGTAYTVMFGSAGKSGRVTTSTASIFDDVTKRLWRAVGMRLLVDMLTQVRDGIPVVIGDVIVMDLGLEMTRTRFFKLERAFVPWRELHLAQTPGGLAITKGTEGNVKATLSYLDDDNAVVLKVALEAFWKTPDERISSLLV